MTDRRRFCLTLGAAAALWPLRGLAGAQPAAAFLPKTYRNNRGVALPYRLFLPAGATRRRKFPLILWLHGGAGRGDDNRRQIAGGNTAGSRLWASPAVQGRNPCFVLAPQCPAGESWTTLDAARPNRPLLLALELLDDLTKTLSVDPRRLYVTGQSMGGFATWALITLRPGAFAAAVPVCGGGDESQAPRLARVPVWAFHGELDEAVPADRSRRMVGAIRRAGGAPRYTEYKGEGHVIWGRVFAEPELPGWLFSHTR